MASLNQLRDEIYACAKEHGWWDDERTFGDIIALIHSEASEALEEFRMRSDIRDDRVQVDEQGMEKPIGVPSEFADIIIRVLDACGHYGIDIEGVVDRKVTYNWTRPHRHGGKAL